jgi:uncharacterized protein YbbC (DUF1343 family)
MKKLLLIILLITTQLSYAAHPIIKPGADQTRLYFPMLKGKRVGVFANNTSRIGKRSLIDVMREHGITVTKIFVPEHGFRGEADAGNHIHNSVDPDTGIPIVSLYGKKFKPSKADLANVDILVFDIQDVGVRFYTYISSLQKFMEAALENNKPLIVLDRPNPNGFYVDGPVLDPKHKSFTGMQPIPVVYGMTMGEYAKMLIGEEWLSEAPVKRAKLLKLYIIPCANYSHKSHYIPPVRPSPNLPDIQSIYLYPSIGLLEATALSVGRGTDKPFQYFGHPDLKNPFTFVPKTMYGSDSPSYKNKVCHGWNLAGDQQHVLKEVNSRLQIKYMMEAYKAFPDKNKFFGVSVNHTWGKNNLAGLIVSGQSEKQIRQSWEPQLSEFKKIRKKYLLYPDFY